MITLLVTASISLLIGYGFGFAFAKRRTANIIQIDNQLELKTKIKQKENSLNHILNLMIHSAKNYSTTGVKTIHSISENCSISANMVSTDLNEITTIIATQLDKVRAIRKMTSTTGQSVMTGNQNIEGIQNTLNSFLSTQQTLKTIDDQLSAIHDQSLEIEKIGKEAEMLALNAAIESARAGEAGRGFAVVADNMKFLAKNSQSTSLEIADTLNSNRKNIAVIVEKVNQETTSLHSQLEILFSAFSHIEQDINEIQNQVREFEADSENTNTIAKQLTQATHTTMEDIIHKLVDLSSQISGRKVKDISPEEVKANLSKFDEIIDVRQAQEFNDELGHIEQAKLITLQTDLKQALTQFDPTKCYLFVCRSGGRSAKAAQLALTEGIENVYNMTGGMLKWRTEN